MKIIEILEAKYYGRHSVDDIVKRLQELSKASGPSIRGSVDDVIVDIPTKLDYGMYAWFTVRGAKTKEDVKYKIKHFLRHHNIPYDDIYEIVHHALPDDINPTTRWTAIMSYDPGLTEARYYGKHNVDDVRNRLEQTAREHNKHENVRILEAWQGDDDADFKYGIGVVYAHLYVVNADSKQDAENEIRLYLKKFGIPYTGIQDLEQYPTPINDHRSAWEATMVYDPQQSVTEARYSGRWSVIDVANRLNHKFNRTENIRVIERNTHIEDPAFASEAANLLIELIEKKDQDN